MVSWRKSLELGARRYTELSAHKEKGLVGRVTSPCLSLFAVTKTSRAVPFKRRNDTILQLAQRRSPARMCTAGSTL